jgi:hypothetical protein
MSVQLASEIWGLVRDMLPYDDREQVAEGLVGILMDHGFDLDDICYEFTGDVVVQEALRYYSEETELDEPEDYDNYSDDEENYD